MKNINKKEIFVLFLGDLLFFLISLWLTLWLRYFEFPGEQLFFNHLFPFSFLFFAWIAVFFISGLYEKRILIIKRKLFANIFIVQVINSLIASLFFYFFPYFQIAPKTNLFLYLIISFFLILIWRVYIATFIGVRKKANSLIVGYKEEISDIKEAIENSCWYNLDVISFINLKKIDGLDFQRDIFNFILTENISIVIMNFDNEEIKKLLPKFYNLVFTGVKFVSVYDIYEDIFGKIPLSLIKYDWFLKNVSSSSHLLYSVLKRIMDIAISSVLLIISLIFYPFVYLLIKISDGGKIFFTQERIGQGGKKIKISKFRSMKSDGSEVTKIGTFLRKTSIDELPQLFGILKGDLSLVGPRPEKPDLAKIYGEQIPYYDIRHLRKPGMSGWAQINHKEAPHHNADVEKTKEKLSYDLYYIKNHSFLLDIKIALQTIKILISRIFAKEN